jgi:hypothetical protein
MQMADHGVVCPQPIWLKAPLDPNPKMPFRKRKSLLNRADFATCYKQARAST